MSLECWGICSGGGEEMKIKEVSIKVRESDPYNMDVTGIPVMECDYDAQPHSLYVAIENMKWDKVAELLRPNDIADDDVSVVSKFSKGGSEQTVPRHEVLARTWVVRKDENGLVKWRVLPLHAAVIFDAPIIIMKELLKVHPDAARLKDDQGNLPLHLGYREGLNSEKVDLIRNAYPEADAVKNKKGKVPAENLKVSAGVKKLNDDHSKEIAELTEAHEAQIAKKDEEFAALKEAHEAMLVDIHSEVEKLKEEHSAALLKAAEEKEVEIANLKQELEAKSNNRVKKQDSKEEVKKQDSKEEVKKQKSKEEVKQQKLKEEEVKEQESITAALSPTPIVPPKSSTKSKSFFKKLGFFKTEKKGGTTLTKVEEEKPVDTDGDKPVDADKEKPVDTDEENSVGSDKAKASPQEVEVNEVLQ